MLTTNRSQAGRPGMPAGPVARHPRAAVLLVALVTMTSVLAGAAGAAAAATGTLGKLTAAVSLSPTSTIIDRGVRASVTKSSLPRGDSIKSIKLSWGDGTKTVSLKSLRSTASHAYLRPGKFTVRVTITDRHGVTSSAAATEVVKAPGGSYSGPYLSGHYGNLRFFVSGDGTQIQDVSVPSVALTCLPGGAGITSQIVVDSTSLRANGSFSASGSATGAISESGGNYPARFSYTFAGHFTGLNTSGDISLAGTLSEKVTFTDSSARTCSSATQIWTASRDAQPIQPTTRAPVGSYGGPYLSGAYGNFRFFVPAARNELQDVYVPSVELYCTPGSVAVTEPIVIDSISLPANGYFSASLARTGDYDGYVATFHYSFRGHVHGLDPSGTPRMAGSLLVTMTFTDTAARSCTSNVQPWYASRDDQPAQTAGTPPVGSYSGPYLSGAYGNLRFFVSPGTAELQDVWVPSLELTCSPGGATLANRLLLNDVVIKSDGSFTATAQEKGAYDGFATTFTYVLNGHFHGLDPTGTPRLAGSLLETATYMSTTAESCTSNVQPWYATRDAQPVQTTSAPPTGTYGGPYLSGAYGNISFNVTSGPTELQDISVPNVVMDCVPGNAVVDTTITIPTAAVASNGSFNGTATVEGTYDEVAATWNYTFSGQFHSTGSDGNERAAGVLSATLTYVNGPSYSCTSDLQPWSAELAST